MKKPNRTYPQLGDADMSAKLASRPYHARLAKLQHKLALIQQAYLFSGQSGVVVFEGWDAAGKGSTIRRISATLDPRSFKVWPIGAPRNYYLERHFLLRFMERLPPTGAITIFDRSWYGRVLVERVEGLTAEKRWRSAYREINSFERMVTDDGCRLVKIFLHVTPQVQLARFEERLKNPLKRWKLSYEDFRNRSRWDEYSQAIDEMFAKTSTKQNPWHLIPADDKKYARIAAMKKIVEEFSRGVALSPPDLEPKVLAEARQHFQAHSDLIDSLAGRTD